MFRRGNAAPVVMGLLALGLLLTIFMLNLLHVAVGMLLLAVCLRAWWRLALLPGTCATGHESRRKYQLWVRVCLLHHSRIFSFPQILTKTFIPRSTVTWLRYNRDGCLRTLRRKLRQTLNIKSSDGILPRFSRTQLRGMGNSGVRSEYPCFLCSTNSLRNLDLGRFSHWSPYRLHVH
jgi:hypothetical protein